MGDKVQRMQRFEEDEIILLENSADRSMYKIIKGKVILYSGYRTDEEVVLGVVKDGACFGEFGLLLGAAPIYTAVAYTEVVAMRITEDVLDDFVQHNRQYVIDIMKNMAGSILMMKYHVDMLSNDLESIINDEMLGEYAEPGGADTNEETGGEVKGPSKEKTSSNSSRESAYIRDKAVKAYKSGVRRTLNPNAVRVLRDDIYDAKHAIRDYTVAGTTTGFNKSSMHYLSNRDSADPNRRSRFGHQS